MKALIRIAPWIIFGPLTAPLAIRGFRALRRHERVLAGLYALAIGLIWFDLPLVAAWSVHALAASPS